jgi:hypothetical protein
MIIVRRLCELTAVFKRAGPYTKEFRSDDRTCIMRKVYRLLQLFCMKSMTIWLIRG